MKFNNKIKNCILLILLFVLFIFVSAHSYTKAVCSNLQNSVFRLHVIANSDSLEDQNLKYLVRDKILEYINKISTNASSKDEIMQISTEHLNNIKDIALQTVQDNGYNYTVKVSIGNYVFPSKTYGNITLPPGYYDALKIEIGQGKGQNWWCVMFPPLCFVDATSGVMPDESLEQLKNSLSNEEYNLISSSNSNIEIKFKIVEVLQKFTISGIFM